MFQICSANYGGRRVQITTAIQKTYNFCPFRFYKIRMCVLVNVGVFLFVFFFKFAIAFSDLLSCFFPTCHTRPVAVSPSLIFHLSSLRTAFMSSLFPHTKVFFVVEESLYFRMYPGFVPGKTQYNPGGYSVHHTEVKLVHYTCIRLLMLFTQALVKTVYKGFVPRQGMNHVMIRST